MLHSLRRFQDIFAFSGDRSFSSLRHAFLYKNGDQKWSNLENSIVFLWNQPSLGKKVCVATKHCSHRKTRRGPDTVSMGTASRSSTSNSARLPHPGILRTGWYTTQSKGPETVRWVASPARWHHAETSHNIDIMQCSGVSTAGWTRTSDPCA